VTGSGGVGAYQPEAHRLDLAVVSSLAALTILVGLVGWRLSPLAHQPPDPRTDRVRDVIISLPSRGATVTGVSLFARGGDAGLLSIVGTEGSVNYVAVAGGAAGILQLCDWRSTTVTEIEELPQFQQEAFEGVVDAQFYRQLSWAHLGEPVQRLEWRYFEHELGLVSTDCPIPENYTTAQSGGQLVFRSPRLVMVYPPGVDDDEFAVLGGRDATCVWVTLPWTTFDTRLVQTTMGNYPAEPDDRGTLRTCFDEPITTAAGYEYITTAPVEAQFDVYSERQRLERITFLSGALVGVAGGLLVALLEAVISMLGYRRYLRSNV